MRNFSLPELLYELEFTCSRPPRPEHALIKPNPNSGPPTRPLPTPTNPQRPSISLRSLRLPTLTWLVLRQEPRLRLIFFNGEPHWRGIGLIHNRTRYSILHWSRARSDRSGRARCSNLPSDRLTTDKDPLPGEGLREGHVRVAQGACGDGLSLALIGVRRVRCLDRPCLGRGRLGRSLRNELWWRGEWRMETTAGVVAAVSVPMSCQARTAAGALVAADAVPLWDVVYAHHGCS